MSQLDLENRRIVDSVRRGVDDLIAVYRFGSTADGTAGPATDTDIAVLAWARIPAAARFDLQEQIAAQLGRDVDLIDLAAASTVMAIQVISRGDVLYEGDAAVRGQFEDRIFSAYARLNEERRGSLERIADEGTIYGR